ncbi:MAG: hypothetical protein ACOCQU_00860 [Halolamina sp.]
MRVAIDGTVVAAGRAVDLRAEPIPADAVESAIRDGSSVLSVDCPSPARWWPPLAAPGDDIPALDRIVTAARSRGHRPPAERALAAAQRDLQALAVESTDTATARERLAEAGAAVERLREAVATARGRLQSRRELDADTADAEAALADATRRLSEAETERVAAEQAHAAAQRRVREAREARERRLRLQDRVANRRRDLRRELATVVAEPFAGAVEELPGSATLSTDPLAVGGDEVTAALAAIRIASLDAPVLDTTARFDSAAAAAETLDAPVVRC